MIPTQCVDEIVDITTAYENIFETLRKFGGLLWTIFFPIVETPNHPVSSLQLFQPSAVFFTELDILPIPILANILSQLL